jgi:hypothetical protein
LLKAKNLKENMASKGQKPTAAADEPSPKTIELFAAAAEGCPRAEILFLSGPDIPDGHIGHCLIVCPVRGVRRKGTAGRTDILL